MKTAQAAGVLVLALLAILSAMALAKAKADLYRCQESFGSLYTEHMAVKDANRKFAKAFLTPPKLDITKQASGDLIITIDGKHQYQVPRVCAQTLKT
jgi:hypothetical protein